MDGVVVATTLEKFGSGLEALSLCVPPASSGLDSPPLSGSPAARPCCSSPRSPCCRESAARPRNARPRHRAGSEDSEGSGSPGSAAGRRLSAQRGGVSAHRRAHPRPARRSASLADRCERKKPVGGSDAPWTEAPSAARGAPLLPGLGSAPSPACARAQSSPELRTPPAAASASLRRAAAAEAKVPTEAGPRWSPSTPLEDSGAVTVCERGAADAVRAQAWVASACLALERVAEAPEASPLETSSGPWTLDALRDAGRLEALAALGVRPLGAPEGAALAGWAVGAASEQGLRPYQEDAVVWVESLFGGGERGAPPVSLLALFDGHNGRGTADCAAARLPALLREALGSAREATAAEPSVVEAAFQAAFARLDAEVLAAQRAPGASSDASGSTALCLLLAGTAVHHAHVGDSRAVLCGAGGAERLTEDHRPDRAPERSKVRAAGGHVAFARCWRVLLRARDGRAVAGLAVSRALGDVEFKEPRPLICAEPEVGCRRLGAGDAFALCATDGVWDVLSDEEATRVVQRVMLREARLGEAFVPAPRERARLVAQRAAQALVEVALRRGSTDNVSVAVSVPLWKES